MKNKKLTLLVVLTVILLALIGVAVALVAPDGGENPTEPGGTMQETEIQATEPQETEKPDQQTEAPQIPSTEIPETQPAEVTEPENGQSGTIKPSKNPTTIISTVTEPPALEFPYAIPGTDLVIQKMDSYDGIFLEDGSDQSVTGICALVLVNKGSVGVEYANIEIAQNGKTLVFKATALPAGATIVVQEAGTAAYSAADCTACTADVAVAEIFEMSASRIEVKENDDGSLQVTNLTNETIPTVRLFYKFALEKGTVYVGGITYTAKITDLGPGASQQVIPSHYAAGSSEIVMVRTYESAQ